jgi:L-alanine-DL-glutamate epimerase-like enolase superfamily enzyme
MALSLSLAPLDLALKHPFKIARGEETVAHSVLFRLRDGELEGLGEATPVERYHESPDSVAYYFAHHPLSSQDPFALETLIDRRIPPAARAGLDLALHDLMGKELGKPLYALLGLDPSRAPLTSFTIGIADPETTLRKVAEAGDYPMLKVKLGAGTRASRSRRSRRSATVYRRNSYRRQRRLERRRGDYDSCANSRATRSSSASSPIAAGNPQWLRAIRDRVSKIPIVTDEDSLVASDLPPLIRLRRRRQRQARQDRRHSRRAGDDPHRARDGLKVMLGCMVESAIAATAAAHVSPLADWADHRRTVLDRAIRSPACATIAASSCCPSARARRARRRVAA